MLFSLSRTSSIVFGHFGRWYRSLTDCAASLCSETRTEAFFSGLGPTDFSLPRGNYNPGLLPQERLRS